MKKNWGLTLEKLFICILTLIIRYPDEENPDNLIDVDDLGINDFFIGCFEDISENKFFQFIWKGPSVQVDEQESLQYIENIKIKFFSKECLPFVSTIEEVPYSESDEFMNMLWIK
jgi:hypothetical protein